MIEHYKARMVQELYETGKCPNQWRAFKKAAIRKLMMLDAATNLSDLQSPPGNRLEKLKGDRESQYSIRINNKWRICFEWGTGAKEVEIVDYH